MNSGTFNADSADISSFTYSDKSMFIAGNLTEEPCPSCDTKLLVTDLTKSTSTTDIPLGELSAFFSANSTSITGTQLAEATISCSNKSARITDKFNITDYLSLKRSVSCPNISTLTKDSLRRDQTEEFTDKLPHSNEPLDHSSSRQRSPCYGFATNQLPSKVSSDKTLLQSSEDNK